MFRSIIPEYVPNEISFASPKVGLIPACVMLPSREIRASVSGFCASPLNLHVTVFGPTLSGLSTTHRSAISLDVSDSLEQPLDKEFENAKNAHTTSARV